MADPDGGTEGTGALGALGARSPSSGDGGIVTDSGFSLALVQRMLFILLVAPVTTATVERSNTSLAYVKTDLRSTTGGGRLNDMITAAYPEGVRGGSKKPLPGAR